MNLQKVKESILPVLTYVLYNLIVYYFFVLPLHLWFGAVDRLLKQKENNSLSLINSTSEWPFLSFIKRFLFDFAFDAIIFLMYVLGPIIVIIGALSDVGVSPVGGLIICYFAPTFITIEKEILALLILPIKKFISWARKPAQYMDLTIDNK